MAVTASNDVMGGRRTAVFLSLLPPLTGDRRLATLLGVVSLAVFVVLVPFARQPLAPVPAFIPAYQAALLISDLVTAAVLFGQFSIQRTRPLLVLASAYFFTALAIVPHTLSFPGLFAPGGLMGSGPQTTVWLFMLWHGGFPLLILLYAVVKQDDRPLTHPSVALLGAMAAAAAAVGAAAFLTTADHELLPTLLKPDNAYTPAMLAVVLAVWALNLLALLGLWLRRPHTALDLWMMVVMVAWTCDVGLSAALNARRFDLGFYAGRAYGLAAAIFVLVMLLLETRALYARLARNLASERAAAEGRAAVSARLSREAAETLRAVVDASHQAVIALSPTGTVLLWNKAAERMFGYRSDEVVGKPYPRRASEQAAEAEQKKLVARVLSGERLTNLSFSRRHKDGTERDLRGGASPFYDPTGAVAGAVYVLDDVTDKLATEQMLRQAQKMEAVGQLTGGVAHDFNNMLMVILANVEELLEDDELSPGQRERLAGISASGERAAELTRRLLAFSRQQRLVPQPTDLTDLVAGTDKLMRRTLGEQIEIEAIFADDLWTTSIDRAQLEAALVNLCVNARDAMPNGGRLLIETKNTELDRAYALANPGVVPGKYVMLAVSDTGIGMPPDVLSRAFEPFFTTKEVGKGTGLGLSMVYGFIKQSNGHIKIYSEVGRGTTVRLYMPRSDAPAEGDKRAAVATPRGMERILLVEDDARVRNAVLGQLRSLGYSVTEVAGGQAALDRLEAGATFDLMISDVVMPGIAGPELAAAIAARWPAMRIVFMSGYSENAAISHGRVAAGARILSKPFRKIDLATCVREALDDT
jgi:PAS domain S-box-containing protein